MSEEEKFDVFPFIEGKTVDLVASSSKLAQITARWMNDPEVRQYSRNPWPLSLEDIQKWFEPSSDRGVKDFVVFNIYHKKDKKIIGAIGLNHINWLNRNANIFAQIGVKEYWGKGIAGEASELIIEYGFSELNLHKIYSRVFTPNTRSLRAAEKLGFTEEAVLKEEIYVDGKYVDVHKFALLKKDWMERKNRS
ncbi:MAG: GNAT family N-acetyltransferase [Promethearchaeota archaeon]|jgi:RimJ/RimL family protein N-acetyltransferase